MTDRDALTSDLRAACMRIARRVRHESATEVAPHLLTVLFLIDRGLRTASEIADHEKVSAPSMSKSIGTLVERGLIARTPDPTDGRCSLLDLTDAGRAHLAHTRDSRDQWLARRLDGLTPDELALLARATTLLERVAAE